jgi:hypothetical protein
VKPQLAETDKHPGLAYAVSSDGIELPVIDITHPAFQIDLDPRTISSLLERYAAEEQRRARMPKLLQRPLLRIMLGGSRLGRAFLASSGGVLGSMPTYLAKLGPTNLGRAWAGRIDRAIAAAAPSVLARVRLEDMARLLEEGLTPVLGGRPRQPLTLVNVAGGPAADSWNALILLRRRDPALLLGRPIRIEVLDIDDSGPAFGARALAALGNDGGPLAGVDLLFRHRNYDWREPSRLESMLGGIEGAVALSSEGGLFDYGTDDEIGGHLERFRRLAPPDAVVVGSVSRSGGPGLERSQFAIRLRTLEEFRGIAEAAGWAIARAIERPLSNNVRLTRLD